MEYFKTKTYNSLRGAVDLPSIMTGLIVLGIIAGTVSATLFGVIPWTQDNATKKELTEIRKTQETYVTTQSNLNANTILTQSSKYGSLSDLVNAKLLTYTLKPTYTNTNTEGDLCVTTTTDKSHWTAIKISKTGRAYYLTEKLAEPQKVQTTDTTMKALLTNECRNLNPIQK